MLAYAEGSSWLSIMEFQPLTSSFRKVCSGTAVEHILKSINDQELVPRALARLPAASGEVLSPCLMSFPDSFQGLWKTESVLSPELTQHSTAALQAQCHSSGIFQHGAGSCWEQSRAKPCCSPPSHFPRWALCPCTFARGGSRWD